MYPRVRIDALTDGLFGVAMTILVLNLKLPDGFHPADAGALTQALWELWPKFLPYVLSFYVLGSIWLSNIKLRSRSDFVDKRYVFWWLLYLLFATCLPFSTSVVGEFAHYRSGVWLYSLNLAILAASGYRLVALSPNLEDDEQVLDRKVSLRLLMATCALCAGLSLISPSKALWVYVLNVGAPYLARWIGSKRGPQDNPV
jgi:uncharacterized membrane protein